MEAARRLGLEVTVGSERRQAFASLFPGGHLQLDFLRPRQAVRAIAAFARSYPLDAVVAVDDDGTLLAAAAAKALGLPHNPVTAVAATRNKHRLRRKVAAAGLPSPRFERLSIADDPARAALRMPFPCVLKPLHLAASRGVMRADDADQFVAAFERLTAILRTPDVVQRGGRLARHVLVEAFIPGTEVALEGLLAGGELVVLRRVRQARSAGRTVFRGDVVRDAVAAAGWRTGRHRRADGPSGGGHRAAGRPRARRVARQRARRLAHRHGGAVDRRAVLPYPAIRGGYVAGGVATDAGSRRRRGGLSTRERRRRRDDAAHSAARRVARRRWAGSSETGSGNRTGLAITIALGQEVVPLPEGVQYLGFLFARGDTLEEVETSLRSGHRCLSFTIEGNEP